MSINQKDIFKHFSSSQEVAGEHFFSRSFSVFMKVMEEKKFSAAAVKLQLTQSSISQTIAGLETSLGVDLFNRESRPPQPTKEAVKLYEALKESEKNVSQILVNIQYENLVKPAVRIGMIESAGKVIAADAENPRSRFSYVRTQRNFDGTIERGKLGYCCIGRRGKS